MNFFCVHPLCSFRIGLVCSNLGFLMSMLTYECVDGLLTCSKTGNLVPRKLGRFAVSDLFLWNVGFPHCFPIHELVCLVTYWIQNFTISKVWNSLVARHFKILSLQASPSLVNLAAPCWTLISHKLQDKDGVNQLEVLDQGVARITWFFNWFGW
jgi:hypothetical protein